ncbi:hypothetical protein HYE82_02760 [Streptomyces sp. BR123]|uniref:hypothetical protein n=1 Tax=Streptomyces sp. BR123 TaxID=2749828 RepID=UPI0015C48FE5|nr:hypothetical protein [Streptomyces sp. BR123]NXY93349.1 hypothetical protein [Streptomyces sp. BR123]
MVRTEFPDDLLLTQIRVIRAYATLARQPRGGTAPLRRALIHELRLLYAHPYWTDAAHSYADLVELRRLARARAWVEAA